MEVNSFMNYHCWETKEWKALAEHTKEVEKHHLRELLMNKDRFNQMSVEFDGIVFDYTRQRILPETLVK